MAKIIILDDNRSTGSLLKRALEREDHQVSLMTDWEKFSATTDDSDVDLVLIHLTLQKDFGWTAFNQFKSTYQDTPAMLCAMPVYSWTSMDWIIEAVQEALAHMKKVDDPTALWAWDTGANDSRIGHTIL